MYANNYNQKGNSLSHLKRYEEALAVYERATQLNPRDASTYTQKGMALSHLKRYEEAIVVYEQAIQLNPNDDSIKFEKEVIRMQLFLSLLSSKISEMFTQALELLKKART